MPVARESRVPRQKHIDERRDMMAILEQDLAVRRIEQQDEGEAPESPSTEVAAVVPPFEEGLVKALVLGGILGFLIVFALVVAVMRFAAHQDLVTSAACGIFVGAFGGFGFGAMTGASLHKAPGPKHAR
jgi:hypothetical protein